MLVMDNEGTTKMDFLRYPTPFFVGFPLQLGLQSGSIGVQKAISSMCDSMLIYLSHY